ncbi:MAG: iron ABC transporter permease [Planctomycetota bacterium]|nr:iron ABC transporter permease [Planctomycetota bacterium]
MRSRRELFQVWALIALLGVFLGLPIWLTVRGAFVSSVDGSFTFSQITTVLSDSYLREGLLTSLQIAGGTTCLAILLATPMALLAARCQFPGKKFFSAVVLVPMILPPFVGAIGFRQLFDRGGSFEMLMHSVGLPAFDLFGDGGLIGIIIVEALALYPIIYLNLVAALANLDPAMDEAARGMGAGSFRRILRIALPLARPGLFAGSTLVFVWSFTELGTPLMFEYRAVTPVQIFDGLKGLEASREPYALTVVMLTVSIIVYLIGKHLFGRAGTAGVVKASVRATDLPLRSWRAAGATTLFTVITCLAVLPHLGVILTSVGLAGSWWQSLTPRSFTTTYFSDAMSHPLASGSMRNSLFLASIAVAINLVLGIIIARLLVRSRVFGRSILDGMCMLPLAVPGLVMAFGFVAMSLSWPFSGSMPPSLSWVVDPILPTAAMNWLRNAPLQSLGNIMGATPNPFPFLICAYAIRRLPYVVRSASAGLEQTPVALEEAASMTGASRFTVMRRVVTPLVAANLIAGGMLAFSFSMLEVSDSIILAQREPDYPITKAIYTLHERLGDGDAIASAMGVWAMFLLAATLAGASLLMGKRLGAVFRG